jgi:hypothetical protein
MFLQKLEVILKKNLEITEFLSGCSGGKEA